MILLSHSGRSLSICTFFNSATIICGIALILLGLGYGVAAFRGEKPIDPKAVAPKQSVPEGAAEAGQAPPPATVSQRAGSALVDFQKRAAGAVDSVKLQVGKVVVNTAL
jgi:hypothetical protein